MEYELNKLMDEFENRMINECKTEMDVTNILLEINCLEHRKFIDKAIVRYYNEYGKLMKTERNEKYIIRCFIENCIKTDSGVFKLKENK